MVLLDPCCRLYYHTILVPRCHWPYILTHTHTGQACQPSRLILALSVGVHVLDTSASPPLFCVVMQSFHICIIHSTYQHRIRAVESFLFLKPTGLCESEPLTHQHHASALHVPSQPQEQVHTARPVPPVGRDLQAQAKKSLEGFNSLWKTLRASAFCLRARAS